MGFKNMKMKLAFSPVKFANLLKFSGSIFTFHSSCRRFFRISFPSVLLWSERIRFLLILKPEILIQLLSNRNGGNRSVGNCGCYLSVFLAYDITDSKNIGNTCSHIFICFNITPLIQFRSLSD